MDGSVEALSTETGNEPTEKTMPAKTRLRVIDKNLWRSKLELSIESMPSKGSENISRMARFRKEWNL